MAKGLQIFRTMVVRLHSLTVMALALGLVVGCDVGTFGEGNGGGGVDGGGGVAPLTFNGQISQDAASCLGCHGAGLQEGGYRMDTYAGTIAAGNDGIPNVDVINVLDSELIQEIDPAQAPRTQHTAFATAERVQLYTDWITAGAPEGTP